MEDSLRHLQKLGFTNYEARAYVALLQDHPSTRYQLSQNAAIPESKIYEVVRRLQDRGIITGLQGRPPRFVPLPPDQLVSQLERRAHESLEYLRDSFPRIEGQPAVQWLWNIEGHDEIIAQARGLLAEATKDILVAMWYAEAQVLAGDLRAANERGIPVTYLAYDRCGIDFGEVKVHGYEENLTAELVDEQGRLLALVIDGARALVASSMDGRPCGVWSNHSALASIVRRYIMEHFYDR